MAMISDVRAARKNAMKRQAEQVKQSPNKNARFADNMCTMRLLNEQSTYDGISTFNGLRAMFVCGGRVPIVKVLFIFCCVRL